MINYVPVPLHRVQIGKPVPVDIWSPDGHQLLLRRDHVVESEAHRDKLSNHQASMTEGDAQAWQRSLERQVYLEGGNLALLDQMPLPSEITERDYLSDHAVIGGWLDLQDILRGLLCQGQDAFNPQPRLQALEDKALKLAREDADEGLFVLLQTLPKLDLGYCATHSLLCGLVSVLSAEKMGLPMAIYPILMRAAMVMNIGMAQLQDVLAQQRAVPDADQRQAIDKHTDSGVQILRNLGEQRQTVLDLVQWHHQPDASALAGNSVLMLHLLNLCDVLLAKMAPRKVRPALLPLVATKSMVMQSTETTAGLRRAIASSLGFYPPGSYVTLANGETAVVIARGQRANTPHVACIINAAGMPLGKYLYRDTHQPPLAVKSALEPHKVHVTVNLAKVRQLRQHYGV